MSSNVDPARGSTPAAPPLPAAAKATLRQHFRQRRRAAVASAPAGLAAAALAALPPHLAPPRRLGLYWPVGHEPDLRPLAEGLPSPWRDHLALPAIRDDRLLYLPWSPGDPLAPDAVGIPAPTAATPLAPEELALLLVPGLAVDHRGLRLGSGGGWYDRLRADPHWRAVPALVVVPAACVVARLPADPWDVPFPGWLAETGLHWIDPAAASASVPAAVPEGGSTASVATS
ncbi:MAG: 5-formyltetrahydrofolate cyclo-ligase [Cyanobacteriota bacterium]|nr:5-formyltetrahydrofolate cyclo-ligase [Cyanobacteriota bacterium]